MATTGEISAKLGLDTQSFKQDIATAKTDFRKFGQEIQDEGRKAGTAAGDSVGEKLVKNLKGKILGEGLAGSLATALGLNLDKIANKIAEVIVGGTKEGFETAIKNEERITAALDARDAKRKTNLELIKKTEGEILSLQKESASIVGSHIEVFSDPNAPDAIFTKKVAGGDLTQDEENKKRTLTARILEKQNELIDLKNVKEESGQKQIDQENEARRAGLTDQQKLEDLLSEQRRIADQLLAKGLTQKELDERRARLVTVTKDVNALDLKITNDRVKAAQDQAKVEEENSKKVRGFLEEQATGEDRLKLLLDDVLDVRKKLLAVAEGTEAYNKLSQEHVEAELKLAKEKANQVRTSTKTKDKNADASKLSLEELANLDPFQTGVSSDVGRQGSQAREALSLKKQAEDARKSGNSDQAEELRGKYDTIRGGLSALKSDDRGVKEDLTQALVPTNQLLATIDKTLGSKFKSQ